MDVLLQKRRTPRGFSRARHRMRVDASLGSWTGNRRWVTFCSAFSSEPQLYETRVLWRFSQHITD